MAAVEPVQAVSSKLLHVLRPALTWLILAALCLLGARAHADSYPEASVKAIYLYRFAGYVEWPPEASSRARFTIAVLADDAVAEALARVLPNHPVGNRPTEVRIARSSQDLSDAQIVYVGRRFQGDLGELISKFAHQPVLVVTDKEEALRLGSMVNFVLTDHRVRFEISPSAAEHAGLKISSQLLTVAVHVQTGSLRPLRALDTPMLASATCPSCVRTVVVR